LRDLFCQFGQCGVHLGVAALCLANLAASVHNSRMVPAAQMAANFLKPCNEKKLKSSDFFLDFTGPTDIIIIEYLGNQDIQEEW